MAVGQSHPKRPAPARPATPGAGVRVALLAVLALLLVLVLVTRRDRVPARAGSARTMSARPHPAGSTNSASDGRGVEAPGAPPLAAESTARNSPSYDTPSLGSEDPAATHRRRERDWTEVPGGPPPRHQRTRRRPRAEGGAVAAGSAGQPAVVASEVGTQGAPPGAAPAGEPAGLARGERTPAVAAAPPPVPPEVVESPVATEYETFNETDAGEQKGLTGAGGTISFWLQPAWDGTSQDGASFVRIGDDRVRISKSDTYLRFEITNADGQPTALGMPIAGWNPGDWHQVVTTWDGRVISFFVDGRLVGQNAYEGQIELPRNPRLYVGTNAPGEPVAPGLVADVRVQNRPLTGDAVSRRFEESRPPQR